MSIHHHPPDAMVAAFAAGTLDGGQHVAIATHLAACEHCRRLMRSMEQVGGAVLADMPPAPLSHRALADVEARLDQPPPPVGTAPAIGENIPGLPGFVRRYRFGPWKWIAPSVHLRPIVLPHAGETRVFLLRSGPGTRMLQHSHTGLEMTCVLAGGFKQDGQQFSAGDFDFGDDTVEHQPIVDPGEDCICLVAMQGDLRLIGLIGRIVQPFVRL